MSNIQQTIDKRIEEKNRKAERIKESSAKGYYVKTAKYSKTPVEDIKFNCRYFIAEQTAYTGTISDLTGTVLTFDNVDSGDGGSYTATGTYYCSGFSWVTNIWAGYYLKCNGGYFRIESNTADTLTFREEIDITPASADWEIVPFISNSMYNAELNPNTGQDEVFTIKSNTDTTITVAPSGSILLTDVASATDTFEVKKYYAPRIEDFDDQGAGTIQSKIVDAPFGKLVDKNMGAHFAGVYSVRLLCFNSKSFQIKLDVPDSLRVVETQGDDENVLLDSRFGQNTANVLALNFTASVWKRLDFFYYTSRGDYGFTIEGLNDPIGNYVDAWSDVTPDAPSNVVATGYTCKIKITWVNTGLIGTGGGTQIYRSTSEGGTYTFVNFVPWDGNEYTDAGLDGETTYYYKLKSRNNRGDLSDYSSVVNATTSPEVGDPGYALRIACVSGSHSIDGNNAYYKSGDVLSITISSPVALTAAPTVTVAGEAASFVSSTHEYTNCIYTYTIAGTEDEGTQAIVASGTGKEGGTTISGTANIFLDFVAPTVTGTPIIISADDDLKTGDQYAYHADKIWVFTTDDLLDTSGDPAETSGLNRIYLQNAFVGTSTAVGSSYLIDSVLASIFANDYWNNYYLTDSAGTTRQIIDYVGASGRIAMIGTPAAGAYYITKYPIATITSWRNYDVSNRQVIIWNLTLDMPYTTATIPDTITLSTNHKYRVIAKITDQSLNASALCYDDIYLDQTAPGVVTGLTANPDIQSIILKFTTPGAIDLDRINIYMNTSAGIAEDNVPTNYVKMYCMADAIPNKASEFVVYFDEPEELTRYFVCTAVDKSGREGVCSSEVSAATLPHWGKLFRNYFDNGSFERLASAEVPVSWTRHGSATVEQDPQFGDNCIEINSEVNYYSYDYLWLPANPDTYFFTFSIYAKYIAPDADVLFDFIWYDRNGDDISKTSLGIGGGNGFYYEDDFEGGDFAKWDAVGSDWSVQDAVVISGDYSAQCDVTAWESEDAKLEKSGVWKNFTIEGDIRVNQKYGVCQKATIGGRSDGTGWIYYGLSMRPGDGGHFQYYDGTAFYNFPNDKTWDVDTVYHFKITYDFTNSIQYTWVDGFYLGERSMKDGHGVLLNDNRYFEKVSIFGSSGWESGHDYLYADNIEIYKTTHEYTNGFYDEDGDEAFVLTDSYARYHTYFGSGYNEIPSNADYVFIKIMGFDERVAHADAVQWEETSSGGMMPTAFVNNRVDSGQRAMYKYIRGSMIEADTLTTDLIRIGAQTSIYSGTLSSTAYNSVTWATGYLKVGGETYTITGSSHASLTASKRYYLYFDKNTSTTTFQITLTQSTAYGDDKVLIAIVDTGEVFNYAASITPMHSSGTIINGSQIRTGEIASHDGYTYFHLDNGQIVIYKSGNRVILGKTDTGKYGIRIYDASGNLLMQVDDDDQLLQSADTKSYVDLKNSEIGMNDGGGNEVIINPTEGLIGKHNSYKTFDVGATTGRAFFRGGVMSGRMSCIPLYATAFGLDKTDTGIAEIKIDDDSWDFGNGVIVGEMCYLNGYIYVCISGNELTYYVPIIGKINCITNAFTWEPILSMADAGTIGGICTDGTYIWVAASVDTNDDLVEDTVKVYKISPTTLEIIASYAIDAPANLATPLEMCYDGTYLWIADFTDANTNIIYFKISDQTDGVVALTYESSSVCFDGTYIWVGEVGPKLGKIDPATKALTEYNHNGWGGVCFDGTHVWAANADVINPQVKKIDPSSPTTALATISTSDAPCRMVFDGRLMFVCCPGDAVVDVIDIFTNTKLGTDKSSAFAFYICFDGLNFWESGYGNTNYVTKIPH